MVICGLKLTHDGSVAIVDNGKLVFCIEMEKLNNNPRYSSIENTSVIENTLLKQGYRLEDIDFFAIDGWGGYSQDALAIQPRLSIGDSNNILSIINKEENISLRIAQYQERNLKDDILKPQNYDDLIIDDKPTIVYDSFLHVTGHVMSAYCSSPFAQNRESSYILVWDGGMYPRLYFFDVESKKIENLGPICLLIGNIYTIFSQHFGPFKTKGNFAKDDLSIAGKVMAYIALGNLRRELLPIFDEIYKETYNHPMGFANIFANEFKKRIVGLNYSDEDILLSFHVFLEELLVDKLHKKIARSGKINQNICIAGGCALNIKWNSAIRDSGVFKDVYVPPFPNDSGSAIGVACAAMLNKTGRYHLDWSVYSGPDVIKNEPAENWQKMPFSIKELAYLLHETNEPVVLLNGKAELGPRALGNRSIIGAASSLRMKDILNTIKQRESYRPVSPICLVECAEEIFEPGTQDPFMLFDHQVREHWIDKLPAIMHLDGTARLQTVSEKHNKPLAQLLRAYQEITSIPVLCNTSANFNGKGFFPDIHSVTEWGGVNYVWSEDTLYFKKEVRPQQRIIQETSKEYVFELEGIEEEIELFA
ncbi:MAG: nodulation protein NodU [Arcicella sp.]|jgi:carbamoyltransferase|nr:nodulation protein NodU [Arcicella sp.]